MSWVVRSLVVGLVLAIAGCGSPEDPGTEAAAPSPAGDPPTAATGTIEQTAPGEAASSYDGVLAQLEGLEGDERREALIELASEAGPVSLYASIAADVGEAMLPAFEEDTGVTVELFRGGSDEVRTRLEQELAAEAIGADVVETNGVELALLGQQGLFVSHEPPNVDQLIDDVVQPDGWTATRLNIFTVAVNTDAVAEDERPETYQDLADPRWDGRLVMELDDQVWFKEVHEYLLAEEGMSEDEADQLFADMADGAAFVSGHSTMRQLVIAGEYHVAASDYSYGVEQAADEGAPIAWRPPVEPLFALPNGIALVEEADNPAGALLFYEWWLSDGQEMLPDLAIDPVRADLQEAGDADVRLVDVADYVAAAEEWTDRYRSLANAGEVIEG